MVSYAPGGRSPRDINAKTKVTARAKIYNITPHIVQKLTPIIINRSNLPPSRRIAKNNPKVIKMGIAVIATLDVRHINNSVSVGNEKPQAMQ